MKQKHYYNWRIIPQDRLTVIFVNLKTFLTYFNDLGFVYTEDDIKGVGQSIDGFLLNFYDTFGDEEVKELSETEGAVKFTGEYDYLYNNPDKAIVESLTAMFGPQEIE